MGWAAHYIAKLLDGNTVKFRPRGNSMEGRIRSGQLCTVVPLKEYSALKKGDIVLCKVGRSEYLHLISSIKQERFQISNNKGFVNGWISGTSIYGICVNIEN